MGIIPFLNLPSLLYLLTLLVIYGIDLVPMFPNSIKPKNAKFLHHNILKDLPFPDNSFDYVHMRLMLCNLTQAQLIHLLAEISRILKPSAFVELVDVEYRVQRPGPLSEELLNRKCMYNLHIAVYLLLTIFLYHSASDNALT